MFVKKNLSLVSILKFTGGHIIWISAWVCAVAFLYEYTGWQWLAIPWLPLSLIGVAVAFYVGFKNNQAYDRLWEARKIWGGIVNSSRKFGAEVTALINNQFTDKVDGNEIYEIKKRLIYRHIAWLYILRSQLLKPTPWEHIKQSKMIAMATKKRMKTFGVGLVAGEVTVDTLRDLIPGEECSALGSYANAATQFIRHQSLELSQLRKRDLLDDFRQMELQNILNEFYEHQGKCERIKKFPFPRQYGGMSLIFVGIFIFLLPFGMLSQFQSMGDAAAWVACPLTVLIAWIFITMELIGDYSENPFEGLGNDVPMLSLVRTIEIDLREMLGEKKIPPPIDAKKGVLM